MSLALQTLRTLRSCRPDLNRPDPSQIPGRSVDNQVCHISFPIAIFWFLVLPPSGVKPSSGLSAAQVFECDRWPCRSSVLLNLFLLVPRRLGGLLKPLRRSRGAESQPTIPPAKPLRAALQPLRRFLDTEDLRGHSRNCTFPGTCVRNHDSQRYHPERSIPVTCRFPGT